MKEKPVKNASPDQKKLFGKSVVKNIVLCRDPQEAGIIDRLEVVS
jgi:hypothetical protein